MINYGFRPSRTRLKVIKDIKRSQRIRFQVLNYQNRPPNDDKKTNSTNYWFKIDDFMVSRFCGYLSHFQIFFKSYFYSAFSPLMCIFPRHLIVSTIFNLDGIGQRISKTGLFSGIFWKIGSTYFFQKMLFMPSDPLEKV